MKKQKDTVLELPKNFETLSAAVAESRIRQKHLLRGPRTSQRRLAEKLASCAPDERCRSAACPVCFREYRVALFAEVCNLYRNHKGWKALTLIYYTDAMATREISRWHPDQLKRRLGRQLERSGMKGPVIGSVEVVFHPDQKRWLPHFHLILPWDQVGFDNLRRTMTRRPNMETRPGIKSRPMHQEDVTSPPGAMTYLFKTMWVRKERYTDKDGKSKTSKPLRLKEPHHRLSLKKLDQIGFSGLRFLYGLRANGQSWQPKLSTSPKKK